MDRTKDELAMEAARILDSKKGDDILIIDIREKASFADYFVMASASNIRLLKNLVEEVEKALDVKGISVRHIEGAADSGWVLMDYGDVIINVLSSEMRDRYNIEKVWGDCEFIRLGVN